MDALTLSGLQAGINTAGSVTSSLFGNLFNRNEWKRQAEYSSPVNQMARLKQAGLNPHLVYGNGASVPVGNMNQPAQVTAPEIDTDFQSKINAYTENELRKQQTSVQHKQQEVQEAQINLIKAQELNTLTNANKTALDTQCIVTGKQIGRAHV